MKSFLTGETILILKKNCNSNRKSTKVKKTLRISSNLKKKNNPVKALKCEREISKQSPMVLTLDSAFHLLIFQILIGDISHRKKQKRESKFYGSFIFNYLT